MNLEIEDIHGKKLFFKNTRVLIIVQENHKSDKPPEFHTESIQLNDDFKGVLKIKKENIS